MFLPVTPKPTKGVKAKRVFHRTSMKACFIKFNPIEFVWSKVGAYLRKVEARVAEELKEAFSQALDTITVADVKGWIKHCGYRL